MTKGQYAEVSALTFSIAMFLYAAAAVAYGYALLFRKDRPKAGRLGTILALVGVAVHVVSILTRGLAAGRVPWGNMFEFSSLLALLMVVGYLVLVEWRMGLRSVAPFVLASAVLIMLVGRLLFYSEPAPLMPALQSYWLKIHVVAAMIGSSLLMLGGLLSILYLVAEKRERGRSGPAPAPIMGGSLETYDPPAYVPGADEPVPSPERARRGILPAAETLDRVAYRVIAVAFPIWTFAVIAGAIWAQEAWGRYWGWDPKEVWSFISWVVFAGYLHARATAGWKGRRAAWVAVIGLGTMLVNLYAVNTFIKGLHTYAKP
jgi:cytochrome c-type biogenesis protein CcsB